MAKSKHKKYSKQSLNIINKGYSETGASYTRKTTKGFTAQSGSPNEDINYNNQTLRERARVLCMSGGLASSAVKTNRTNVIGCGLILKSAVDQDVLGLTPEEAKAWQDNTEKEFALWAEDKHHCDAIGMNDYYKIQQLVFYSTVLNGDCFTFLQHDESNVSKMRPYSFKLNVVEADRIQTPTDSSGSGVTTVTDGINRNNNNDIYDGIEVDKNGKVVAYHVRNTYRNEWSKKSPSWERVEVLGKKTGLPNVIQTMVDVERPGQLRGVSYLAPVIEMLLQIRRYTDAELMAAVVESLFTAFIKTEARTDEMPFNTVDQGEAPIDLSDDEYEMGPGNINILKPGEDVTFADPKRPAGGFQSFIEAVAMQIGATLEVSNEILLKKFNSSYSAARAALLEFWKVVKMRREWFVSDFCRPTYEVFVFEAVARGRIKAPGFFDDPIKRQAWLGAEFIGPPPGTLDPVKEITAEILSCENGFSTRADSTIRLNGSEFNKNVVALKGENEMLSNATTLTPDVKEVVMETVKDAIVGEKNNGQKQNES